MKSFILESWMKYKWYINFFNIKIYLLEEVKK